MMVFASVAIINEDLHLVFVFLIVYAVYMAITFKFFIIFHLNMESSTERSQESEIYTIPVYQDPAPRYEAIFEMNTLPPPYEIATKEDWKQMMEESLTIVCLE